MRDVLRRIAFAIALLAVASSLTEARDLTLEQRIDAQESIERVYAEHREGSRRSFDEAVPQSLLESKVRTHLKQSLALERFWNTPLTARMLDRELERIVRNTAMPKRLDQLFAALDHDSVLIRESLVRPVLVRRLTRNFFEKDERIHGESTTTWEAWWQRNAPAFDESEAATVAQATPLPLGLAIVTSDPEGSCAPADTWDNGSLADGLVPRYRHTAVWTGTEMLVFGGVNGGFDEGVRYDPATDVWTRMSRVGAPSGRRYHNAVWTGTEMLVWGGEAPDGSSLGDGRRYDPSTDTWTAMSNVGAPAPRSRAVAVWTGTQMLVWGGTDGSFLDTGGRYDPVGDTWSPMPTMNAPTGRVLHTAVWTGVRMIVWGGFDGTAAVDTGASYHEGVNRWTPISTTDAPPALDDHTAVWTGSRMLVWSRNQVVGGQYNLASDSWTALNDVGAPAPAEDHSSVWTGGEMVIYGGYASGGATAGARLNPINGVWTPISEINAPILEHSSAVWTGTQMIVWGGLIQGGRYDPAGDNWTPVSSQPFIPGSTNCGAVWTGNLMIHADWFGGGQSYDPVLDAWSYIASGGPNSQFGHAVVWSGDEMLSWGGYSAYSMPGARYDPVADSWTPMSMVDAPEGRVMEAGVVWTGSNMIVWGGLGLFGTGDALDVGGVYDPVADTWKPTTQTGAPSKRHSPSAVWTGSEMIIWGGHPFNGSTLDDGARYDPVTDTWTPMSQGPTARENHTTVWTGSKMIVWSGGTSNSGELYDPATDSWAPTSQVNAPDGRFRHSAIWTGREMVVWGGGTAANARTNSGGRYDPVTDTWQATSMTDVPAPRQEHSAVWTGTQMIIWGGYTGTAGRYALGDAFDDDGDGLSECAGDCNDGSAAVFPGAVETCNGLDGDCNGEVDDLDLDLDGRSVCGGAPDCNDGDAGAFASPHEVTGLSWNGKTTLAWSSTAGASGTATVHDIVIGLVSEGAPGSGLSETCVTEPAGTDTTTHSAPPPVGDVYWYLVRGRNSCGSGSYGQQSDGAPRSTPTCP